jgi:hypothetical protein
VFAAFFAVGALLLRGVHTLAGSIFIGVLCLFEVVSFPGWARHNALDWVYQTTFAVVALAGLIAAIAVLTDRARHRAAA